MRGVENNLKDIKIKMEEILKSNTRLIDMHIEKYIPREFDDYSHLLKMIPSRYKLDFKALNKAIAEPFWEFLDRGGKRWRPMLFLLIYEALCENNKDFLDMSVITEIIHNGTLIADDIEDSSKLRRGKPCTYKIFGLDIAINLSNVMYFLPMLILFDKKSEVSSELARKIYEIYIQEMTNISFGQAIDIAWHKGLISIFEVSEDKFLQMCAYKTGTLARMAARMAAVLAETSDEIVEKLGRFAESIGVAFQIQDDILDLVGDNFAKGKGGLGMDITEGKLSLIVIHALQKAESSDKEELQKILNMHTNDMKIKKKFKNILKKYDSIEYANDLASRLIKDSWNEVDKILKPSEAKEKLMMLTNYLIKREI
jgi:geranylgeranyl pyrophosphate synthase